MRCVRIFRFRQFQYGYLVASLIIPCFSIINTVGIKKFKKTDVNIKIFYLRNSAIKNVKRTYSICSNSCKIMRHYVCQTNVEFHNFTEITLINFNIGIL